MSPRAKVRVCIFAVVALCLLSVGRFLVQAANSEGGPFPSQRWQLLALRNALPSRGIVGYIDEGLGTPAERQRYYLTQYELAPLIVQYSADASLVIGNFASADSGRALPSNLIAVHDFGNGIVLLAKVAERPARRHR